MASATVSPAPKPGHQPLGVRDVTKIERLFRRIGGATLLGLALGGGIFTVAAPPAVAAPTTFGSCHARGSGLWVLPDPHCTPGATNPAVTQATIHKTICVPGWTTKVRPSTSYTNKVKHQDMYLYGDRLSISHYQEDHFIPLELGGATTSQKNLWPEPGEFNNPKDKLANAAHKDVCDGKITLAYARHAISTNRVAFYRQLHVR